MQLVVLILAILVEVWFRIFRVQLQKERKVRRGKEAKWRPPVPQLLPSQQPSLLPGLPKPRSLQGRWPQIEALPMGQNLQVTTPSGDSS